MLKRLVRHRIFVAFITLIAIAAFMFAPLRHDYEIQNVQQNTQQTTTVTYGAPKGWLSLTKVVNEFTGKTVSQKTSRNLGNLGFDFVIYGAVLVVLLVIHRFGRMGQYENLGN